MIICDLCEKRILINKAEEWYSLPSLLDFIEREHLCIKCYKHLLKKMDAIVEADTALLKTKLTKALKHEAIMLTKIGA